MESTPNVRAYVAEQKRLEFEDQCFKAIRTDSGVLLFPDDNLGQRHIQSYLQYVADNYFNSIAQALNHGEMFTIRNPSLQLQGLMNTRNFPFSVFDFRFIPEKAKYLSESILRDEQKCWHRDGFDITRMPLYQIERSYRGFSNFMSMHPGLVCSAENSQIVRQLNIRESATVELSPRRQDPPKAKVKPKIG